MRHVSMKSMNFLDLEIMVAHVGKGVVPGRGGDSFIQNSLTFLLSPRVPHTRCPPPTRPLFCSADPGLGVGGKVEASLLNASPPRPTISWT